MTKSKNITALKHKLLLYKEDKVMKNNLFVFALIVGTLLAGFSSYMMGSVSGVVVNVFGLAALGFGYIASVSASKVIAECESKQE